MKPSLLSPFLLLITQDFPFEAGQESKCVPREYLGSSVTGRYHFYDASYTNCSRRQLDDNSYLVLMEDRVETELVWLEQVVMDESLLGASRVLDLDRAFKASTSLYGQDTTGSQQVMMDASPFDVLQADQESALVRMDRNLVHRVDTLLPPGWKYMILPNASSGIIPVPLPAIERVKDIVSRVKFDPIIASIVNNISASQIREDIRYLTGEDPKSPIVSRHSFSDGVLIAADWLKRRFEETGASCTLETFLPGFAPNVVCLYPSTVATTETILLSSHYDSRGSFGSTRAPGGDDDGSGTVGLLSIARSIGRLGVKFKKNVQFVTFAGEEQGLLGSLAYARILREQKADLTLVIQADMTGYHKAGEPMQLGLPATIGTPEVAQLISNTSALYSPELVVGITAVCCSDHQSFHENGFPATQVFERNGPIADPMYHNSGDVSEREGYDFEQIRAIAKVEFAALLHAAGFDLAIPSELP